MESNWLTPIPRLLILVAHSVTNLIVTAVTSLGMLFFASLIFGFQPTGNVWVALQPIIPMMIGLYGFGFAFAALVMVMREANTLVDMSSFLVQIFSGANFPVNALPRYLIPVALALPLTYGLDSVRAHLIGTTPLLPVQWELALLIVFMFIMLWIGTAAFRSLERRVRVLGTLGQH
jgi:ABC-2 type transport system permease protein